MSASSVHSPDLYAFQNKALLLPVVLHILVKSIEISFGSAPILKCYNAESCRNMTGIWLIVKEGKSTQNHKDLKQTVFELY